MQRDLQDVRDFTRKLDGFLTDREGSLLYSLANRCRGRGLIVEIGSWKGKSTVWIAKGAQAQGVKILAIDPHTGSPEHQNAAQPVWTFNEFEKNIAAAGVSERVQPLVMTSEAARQQIDQPVEFLFIDGAHEYEAVKLDYELWMPLVIDGGYIAFHDVPWPGVKRQVREVFKDGPFRRLYFSDTLICAQKVSQNSWLDRLRNRWMLTLEDQFERACNSHYPRFIKTNWKNLIKFLRLLCSSRP